MYVSRYTVPPYAGRPVILVTWMILKSVMLDEVNLPGKMIHDPVHVRDLKYVLCLDFETAAMMSEVRKGRG